MCPAENHHAAQHGRLLASEAGYIPSASTILSLSRPPSGQPGSTLRFAALIAASKMVDPLVGAQGRAPTRRAPTPTTIGSMFLHFAIDKVLTHVTVYVTAGSR